MEMIKKFIINSYTYDRMNDMENGDTPLSYSEFYEWNVKCLNESPDDLAWLTGLCNRMTSSKIYLMDEESCAKFSAYAFYFDNAKNIVIVNPR
jgi:hypothetical protein